MSLKILHEIREISQSLVNEKHKLADKLTKKVDELETLLKKQNKNDYNEISDKQFDNLLNEVMPEMKELAELSPVSSIDTDASLVNDKATVKHKANSKEAVAWLQVYYTIEKKTVSLAFQKLEKNIKLIDINDVCSIFLTGLQ